jgi:DNA-binding SARP family transcriptional activator/tetratricopeptide (TPR) repeat protein
MFRLLGPVEAELAGARVPLGPAKQRTVWAVLLANAGRLVLPGELIDRVWDDDPPAQPRQVLYTYVNRVRRQLDELSANGPARLVRHGGGYVLEVEPDQVDVHRFTRLAAAAAVTHRPAGERTALLAEALGLWRAAPLSGLDGAWAAGMRDSWQRQRVDAAVAWAGLEIEAGRHAEVLGRIRAMHTDFPLAEPLTAALMRALVAGGRPAEALDTYAATRARLADELGTDPGPELRGLHQALLRGETAHLRTHLRPPPERPAAPVAVPAQLPAGVYGFVGRAEQLARLDGLLATGAPAVVIAGTAGVGKTALATHWAHRVADRFPDGQLYVNLRGFHQDRRELEPEQVLRGFLGALGVLGERIPADVESQAALYRSLLADKRMLLLLDNARDAEQVRPLLPGTSSSLVVVTSRSQLTSLATTAGAALIGLDLLDPAEAHQLLDSRVGAGRLDAEPGAAAEIVAACARLPLAVSICAARAAQTGFTLAALAAELADSHQRLRVLDSGDAASRVDAVFSWSYRELRPAAARLFRLLGVHPGPDVSVPAAASLAGLPPAEAGALLVELARASLVTEHAPGRYLLHDLLAAYAAGLGDGAESAAALGRLLDHWAHSAHAADRALNPARDPLPLPLDPAAAGARPLAFAAAADALAWFDAERGALLYALRQATATGHDRHAFGLAWALDTVLHRRGHWHDWATAWQDAAAAAERLDPATAAYTYTHLAVARTRLEQHALADGALARSARLAGAAGDDVGLAYTHLALAYLRARQDRHGAALAEAGRALALFRRTTDRNGLAIALNAVGWYSTALGEHDSALASCRQALDIHREDGNRIREAHAWDSLGVAYEQLDRHADAIDCFTRGAALFRDLGDRYEEATTLTRLGEAQARAGLPDARASLTAALDLLTALDHHGAAALAERLRRL